MEAHSTALLAATFAFCGFVLGFFMAWVWRCRQEDWGWRNQELPLINALAHERCTMPGLHSSATCGGSQSITHPLLFTLHRQCPCHAAADEERSCYTPLFSS